MTSLFPRQPISTATTLAKYALVGEADHAAIHARSVRAVFAGDPRGDEFVPVAEYLMNQFAIMTAGRVLSGAGSNHAVTMLNCFVNDIVDDSMAGIMAAATRVAFTMQKGGGIGTDYDTLRPKGALIRSTGSESSGVVSFMEIFNSVGGSVESAGSRRGAQMAVLSVWHPDIEDFINAKAKKGALSGINQSVKVTTAFMDAVRAGQDWDLMFPVPRKDGRHVGTVDRNGVVWFIYKRLPARELWDHILRTTHFRAEPGVIFIDRVNDLNNLAYCETIYGTNPCGEQPLPPNGACDLGSVNLGAMIRNPFTPDATIDLAALEAAVPVMVRMLDNVLDVTAYPLPEQQAEALSKRRIGLGVFGLADALMMLGVRYGSPAAIEATEVLLRTVRDAAYRASIELAKERGAFPLFDATAFLSRPFITALPNDICDGIATHGIRNGVILSIAPTGTTAIHANQASSGIEPVFAHHYTRQVTQSDGSRVPEDVYAGIYLLYCQFHGLDPALPETEASLPDYMATAQTLSIDDHLLTQATCQRHIDASISKTVNCPEDISFEEFSTIYDRAYDLGLKGLTTFRPNHVTGSILSVNLPATPAATLAPVIAPAAPKRRARPNSLEGVTIRVHNPEPDENIYFHINHTIDPVTGCRSVFEVFVTSADHQAMRILAPATVAISRAYRSGDPEYVKELLDSYEKFRGDITIRYEERLFSDLVPLLVYVIRHRDQVLQDECAALSSGTAPALPQPLATEFGPVVRKPITSGGICPRCKSTNTKREGGCFECLDCQHSKCSG